MIIIIVIAIIKYDEAANSKSNHESTVENAIKLFQT